MKVENHVFLTNLLFEKKQWFCKNLYLFTISTPSFFNQILIKDFNIFIRVSIFQDILNENDFNVLFEEIVIHKNFEKPEIATQT